MGEIYSKAGSWSSDFTTRAEGVGPCIDGGPVQRRAGGNTTVSLCPSV